MLAHAMLHLLLEFPTPLRVQSVGDGGFAVMMDAMARVCVEDDSVVGQMRSVVVKRMVKVKADPGAKKLYPRRVRVESGLGGEAGGTDAATAAVAAAAAAGGGSVSADGAGTADERDVEGSEELERLRKLSASAVDGKSLSEAGDSGDDRQTREQRRRRRSSCVHGEEEEEEEGKGEGEGEAGSVEMSYLEGLIDSDWEAAQTRAGGDGESGRDKGHSSEDDGYDSGYESDYNSGLESDDDSRSASSVFPDGDESESDAGEEATWHDVEDRGRPLIPTRMVYVKPSNPTCDRMVTAVRKIRSTFRGRQVYTLVLFRMTRPGMVKVPGQGQSVGGQEQESVRVTMRPNVDSQELARLLYDNRRDSIYIDCFTPPSVLHMAQALRFIESHKPSWRQGQLDVGFRVKAVSIDTPSEDRGGDKTNHGYGAECLTFGVAQFQRELQRYAPHFPGADVFPRRAYMLANTPFETSSCGLSSTPRLILPDIDDIPSGPLVRGGNPLLLAGRIHRSDQLAAAVRHVFEDFGQPKSGVMSMGLAWNDSDTGTKVVGALAREMRRSPTLLAVSETLKLRSRRGNNVGHRGPDYSARQALPDNDTMDTREEDNSMASFPSLPLQYRSANLLNLLHLPLHSVGMDWMPDDRGDRVYKFWGDNTQSSVDTLVGLLEGLTDSTPPDRLASVGMPLPSTHGILARSPDPNSDVGGLTPFYGFMYGMWLANRHLWATKQCTAAWRVYKAKRPRFRRKRTTDWLFSMYALPKDVLAPSYSLRKSQLRSKARRRTD